MGALEKLGRYDIIRELGKGAMGVVYEGRDPNLDRVVAIKTIRVQSLSPEAATEYQGRFRTEARSAARLNHPNIVSVFDSGQDDGIAYLVMEFIQGEDLKQHLECGARFSVRSSIVMVHELLMALDHAHRQNVVHRDIKPANMMMEVSGRIKLTDFGVARIQEPDETNLTQVGGAVGTPKYMSPEQAKGLRGDSRSDVFSAAVVLYELLTGTVPFTGDNQFIVIHQIVSQEAAAPSSLNPEVPAAMDEVVARAMAKNPDERYATAREFALALRTVAQQMNGSGGVQGADVAAELGQFLAKRTVAESPVLSDGSSTGIFSSSLEQALNSTVSHDAELGAWSGVKDSTQPKDFLNFLERFPSGIYARRARTRLQQLEAGAALPDQSTKPQQRPAVNDSTLDATVGVHAAPASAVGPQRKIWPIAAAGSVLACVIGLVMVLKPATSVQEEAKLTSLPQEAASAPASAPAALPASAPSSAPSTPAAGAASRPASAALAVPKPKPSAATVAVPAAPSPAVQPPSAKASPRETIAAPAVQKDPGQSPGPSMAGQACVDRVFVFKIACIAEQCMTDRYRHTQECLQFKEMEREREEQRNSRR